MAKRDDSGEGTELSRSLVALRTATGLRQVEVAAAAGISQSKLSDMERGKALPTPEQADRLVELYKPDPAARDELLRLVNEAINARSDSRLVIQRGSTLAMQRRWRAIEGDAKVVRSYQPAIILGSLQTDEYASVVMRKPLGSPEVLDRAERRARLLAGPPPEHVLIQTEGSLRFRVGSAELMARQMAALLEASATPHVQLGVIPEPHPVDVVTTNAFHLYDEAAAVVGLHVAAATLTGSADVLKFRDLFDKLTSFVVWGDAARAVISAVLADLQREG